MHWFIITLITSTSDWLSILRSFAPFFSLNTLNLLDLFFSCLTKKNFEPLETNCKFKRRTFFSIKTLTGIKQLLPLSRFLEYLRVVNKRKKNRLRKKVGGQNPDIYSWARSRNKANPRISGGTVPYHKVLWPAGVGWRYGAQTSPKEVPRSSPRTAALFPIPIPPTFPQHKPAWSNNTWPSAIEQNNIKYCGTVLPGTPLPKEIVLYMYIEKKLLIKIGEKAMSLL
jgi:hypothetical protein